MLACTKDAQLRTVTTQVGSNFYELRTSGLLAAGGSEEKGWLSLHAGELGVSTTGSCPILCLDNPREPLQEVVAETLS